MQTCALVQNFNSPLDFRDKFTSQLERKIRDLQQAESADRPRPLDLQFVSLETGQLAGSSLSLSSDVIELKGDEPQLNAELKSAFEQVLLNLRVEVESVPVALAIRNPGSSGIRNLYVEMSISALKGDFGVFLQLPSTTQWYTGSVVWNWSEPSEVERKLAKLVGQDLSKEGEAWTFKFEWDALQPQRFRVIQPIVFLHVPGDCKAKINAKVYADSFPEPVVLDAEIAFTVRPRPTRRDLILQKAKDRLASGRQFRATNSTGFLSYSASEMQPFATPIEQATVENKQPNFTKIRPGKASESERQQEP